MGHRSADVVVRTQDQETPMEQILVIENVIALIVPITLYEDTDSEPSKT